MTVMLLEKYTGSSLTWKTLRRIWVQLPLDEWPETDISSKKARNFIATHQIMYHSSCLVCPRVPLPHRLLLHLHRRKLRTAWKFQQQEDSGGASEDRWHEATRKLVGGQRTMTTRNRRMMSCKVCLNGCRSSRKD